MLPVFNGAKLKANEAYLCTMTTTVEVTRSQTTFVITGDIGDEWIRDSAAQLNPYLYLVERDASVQAVIEGAIRQQMLFLQSSPYANSFNLEWDVRHTQWDRLLGRGGFVTTYNYEVDSFAYFLRLCYKYWRRAKDAKNFGQDWLKTVKLLVDIAIKEQHHEEESTYRYVELPRDGCWETCSRTCSDGSEVDVSDFMVPSLLCFSLFLRFLYVPRSPPPFLSANCS